MSIRLPASLLALVTAVLVSLTVAAPARADGGPTASIVPDRTSGYLVYDQTSSKLSARFLLTMSELSMPVADVTRTVDAGDGSPAKQWTTGAYVLTYTKPGTYTPTVTLTDKNNSSNTTEITVTPIRVLTDSGKPTVTITKPKKPGKAASWKRIGGTATDSATKVEFVGLMAVQKRKDTWHVYDFAKRTWRAGTSALNKTINKTKAEPLYMVPDAKGGWRTPKIKGLTGGTLYVATIAFDSGLNMGRKQMTRKVS